MKKLFSILLVLLLFTSCSSNESEETQVAPGIAVEDDYDREYTEENMGLTESKDQEYEGEYSEFQKLIKYYSLTMETKTYDDVYASLKQIIAENDAYIQNSNEYSNSYNYTRTLNMTIRVPRDKSAEFRDDISALGTVTNRSENVQDVTDSYSDVDARLSTLYTEEETYLKLLERADTVEEVLQIQNYLSDTRYQIERYESQKRNYDLLISYDTLNLNLYEVEKITQVEERTIIDEIIDNFMDSIEGIGNMLRSLVVFVFGNILYLALVAVLIYLLYRFRHRFTFKKIRKKTKKIEEENNV